MSEYDDILKEYENAENAKPDLDTTMKTLQAHKSAYADSTLLYGLSGLTETERGRLGPVWHELGTGYRRKVLEDLTRFAEANIEMDYRQVGLLGLTDTDYGVRTRAIDLLWEDESLELMTQLIHMATEDAQPEVRAASATALGRFILAGEVGDLPEDETAIAQQAVIGILQNPKELVEVQRRALEAIANCSHPIVKGAIREAYNSPEQAMRVSAVYAMGRTCDERWHDVVLDELESDDAEMRYEAARAAGELELMDAVPKLARLLLEEDREILAVTVTALGEIGGKEAVRILEALVEKAEDEEDDDLLQAAEDALGNASLVDGMFADFDFGFGGDDDYEDDE